MRRDKTRDELIKNYHILARTYEDLRSQKEVFAQLIDALERGGGKAKGDEEGEIMGAFVRIQLGHGYERAFPSDGLKQAGKRAPTRRPMSKQLRIECPVL